MAMATQSGVAASKVLILVGAGRILLLLFLLPRPRSVDFRCELFELAATFDLEMVIWLHRRPDGIDRAAEWPLVGCVGGAPGGHEGGVNQGGEGSSPYDIALIQAQLRNLAQEVRDLTLSRPVTILTGNSDSGGNLSSYILPAAAVGAMGYCHMCLKGWSFSDVMFITKRNMASAVESMSKQLEQVSSALAATKRHLTQRLENLDGKMDEQIEVSKTIRNEVNDVKTDLSQIGFDVEAIQQMVAGLEEKIELLDNKQDAANAGIWYLCRMAGGIKDGTNAKFFQEADEELKLLDLAQTEQKSVKRLELFLESNKELKAIDSKPNTIVAQNDAKKPMKTFDVPVKNAAVHRSNIFLFRKEGFAL